MSKIVKYGGTIYLCGQTASDPKWDVAEQTRRCLDKVDELLVEAGSNRNKLLSVLIRLRDMNDFAAMNTIYEKWIVDHEKPARTCVEAKMARPDVLVEFTVVAAQ
jgi:enamine deaminase RidA (YjgF/YER057c/UK114 family)